MTGRWVAIVLVPPLAAAFALWLCYRFYAPESRGPFEIAERDFRIYGADGRAIPGTEARLSDPAEKPRHLLVLVPDRALDRDWNSAGVYFRTGERLARWFAARGLPTYRYDARGTGGESGPRRHFSLLSQAEDLRAVAAHALARSKGDAGSGSQSPQLLVVAQGEGCVVSLLAIARFGLSPRALVLFGCGFQDTYLAAWGRRILRNMQASGAREPELRAARARMTRFVAEPFPPVAAPAPVSPGRTPAGREATGPSRNPNLAGLDRAIEFLRSQEARQWTGEAATIRFDRSLERALSRGVRVVHCYGEFDSEIPPEERFRPQRAGARYEACELPRANHFLKIRDSRPEGAFSLALARATPFAPLSAELSRLVLSLAGLEREPATGTR